MKYILKSRVISILLAVYMAVSLLAVPAYAADYNYTYYSQNGWKNNEGTTLTGMCYLTSLAMLVSDLGKKVTPVDMYYANGNVINCNFNKICNYYGLSYTKEAVNTYTSEAAKRQKIAEVLSSGKYPAGILVIGRTNGANHMVVARRVVNGTIYCDDPVNGQNIPITSTWRAADNIISYWMFTPTSKWSSSGAASPSPAANNTNKISVSSVEAGEWSVTIPANYKLLLYSESLSNNSASYCSARESSYKVVCKEKATLSNGAVRYRGRFNTDDSYWFVYNSSMDVKADGAEKQAFYAISSIEYGKWRITIPDIGFTALYDNAEAVENCGGYAGSATLDCVQKAVLSNGTVRYCAPLETTNGITSFWLTWTNEMTIADKNAPATYTVMLDAAGGSVSPSTITVKQGGTYDGLPEPVWNDRNSYSFIGWYTAAEGGSLVESTNGLSVNADHTLYAHWNNLHQATLDPNGGTVSSSSSPIKAEYRSGEYLPVAVRPGYTFDGWYTEKNGGNPVSSGWTSYRKGAYFYAHWTPVTAGHFTVTLDSGGGFLPGECASIEVAAGSTYGELPYAPGPSFGSELIGWYTAPSGGTRVNDNDSLITNADHTLYAQYKKVLYTVTFDPNGGRVPMQGGGHYAHDPTEYIIGANVQTYNHLPVAEWEGHTFKGWYTASDGGTLITNGSTSIHDDHTLYAHWD